MTAMDLETLLQRSNTAWDPQFIILLKEKLGQKLRNCSSIQTFHSHNTWSLLRQWPLPNHQLPLVSKLLCAWLHALLTPHPYLSHKTLLWAFPLWALATYSTENKLTCTLRCCWWVCLLFPWPLSNDTASFSVSSNSMHHRLRIDTTFFPTFYFKPLHSLVKTFVPLKFIPSSFVTIYLLCS